MIGFGDLRVAEERSEQFGQGKTLALTFDDGPLSDERSTSDSALKTILATLAAHNPPIIAEFYMIGERVKKNPALLTLVLAGNHKIQNHTWDHQQLTTSLDKKVIFKEVEDAQNIITKTSGVRPTKLRPPYGVGGWPGHINPKLGLIAHKLNLKIENWDIDTLDWAERKGLRDEPIETKLTWLRGKPRRYAFIKRQFKEAKSNPSRLIVLMHVKTETARDLPAFIAQLEAWGFGFAVP